jgi:hypothetical protein
MRTLQEFWSIEISIFTQRQRNGRLKRAAVAAAQAVVAELPAAVIRIAAAEDHFN